MSKATFAEAFAAGRRPGKRRQVQQQTTTAPKSARDKIKLGDMSQRLSARQFSAQQVAEFRELNRKQMAERARMRELVNAGGRVRAQQGD